MSAEQPSRRHWRRNLAAAICLSPVALAVGSIALGAVHGTAVTYGLYIVLFSAVIGAFNFNFSFVRPFLYRLMHGSREGYHHISGIPGVGTLIVVVGVLLSFGDIVTASVGLLVLLIDTGGLPWFIAATWKYSSSWDGPERLPWW
jgi:hypothetical protein